MSRLALLLKSYAADAEYAKRLIDSFHQHNPTGLTLYCVVPREDLALFAPLACSTVVVLDEQPFEHHFTTEEVHELRPGYINQEVVKLSFWELGLAENYFCVDSDAVFVRDITESDFIAPDGYPYSILVEDNELKVEPRYFRENWKPRAEALVRIADAVGLDTHVLRTCHGHQVFSATVLRSFVEAFLQPRDWSYLDALRLSPYEFSWYNFWLQKSQVIPVHQREPLVKVFHHEAQHLEYILRGIEPSDIARGYLALVVNSNYSRDLGLVPIDASKPVALGQYLSYGEVATLVRAKLRDTVNRRRRRSPR